MRVKGRVWGVGRVMRGGEGNEGESGVHQWREELCLPVMLLSPAGRTAPSSV